MADASKRDINGTADDFNKQAFLWGRRTAHDEAAVERAANIDGAAADGRAETLEEIVARHIEELTAYRNVAYAAHYAALADLGRDNHAIAREIAALPETIRGFGPIKESNLEKAKAHEADLLATYRRPAPKATAAE